MKVRMNVISFTLHHYETNEPIQISFVSPGVKSNVGPTYTSSSNESGSEVWWNDENNIPHHLKVKETLDEISTIFNDALRKS